MSRPKLSVIIPTYRRDHLLRGAIDSARRQTLNEIEVLVSDSACSQATQSIVESFADPRVRYRGNPAGTQLSNHVDPIDETDGPYLSYLHDDDLWEPEYAQTLVGALDSHPECVASFAEQTLMDEEGKTLGAETEENRRHWGRRGLQTGVHKPFYGLVAHRAVPMAMGTVFRRDAYDFRLIPAEAGSAFDLWVSFELAKTGAGIYYVSERLMRYRIHPNRSTDAPTDPGAGSAWCCDQMLRHPGMQPHLSAMRRTAADACAVAAMQHHHWGRHVAARNYARRAASLRMSAGTIGVVAATLLPPMVSAPLLRARRVAKTAVAAAVSAVVQRAMD